MSFCVSRSTHAAKGDWSIHVAHEQSPTCIDYMLRRAEKYHYHRRGSSRNMAHIDFEGYPNSGTGRNAGLSTRQYLPSPLTSPFILVHLNARNAADCVSRWSDNETPISPCIGVCRRSHSSPAMRRDVKIALCRQRTSTFD
ncbi:hypothetical protein KC357_g275 [Hortaea werneckii]|nr:hypothetical protein KC357_g275 [Hortaea werneckii]